MEKKELPFDLMNSKLKPSSSTSKAIDRESYLFMGKEGNGGTRWEMEMEWEMEKD